MSIKDTLEAKKKPIILAVAVVVLVIVIIVVFVPFGGNKGGMSPTKTVTSKKAIIQPPDAAKPIETAKVETPAAAVPATPAAKPDAMKTTPTATAKPGNGAPEAKTATAKAPAAKQAVTTAAAPAKPVAIAKAEPTPAPAKAKTAVSAIKEITKRWAVNTGSFSARKEAEKFAKKLSDAGYENVYITEFKKDGINWHRVRVGFYGSKAEAIKVEGELSSQFNIDTPWAVKPAKNEVARHTK